MAFTMDSIMADVLAHPRGAQIMALMGQRPGLGSIMEADEGLKTEAAGEAISNDMMEAMMKYAPLRSMVTFSGGQMGFEQLEELLRLLNSKE